MHMADMTSLTSRSTAVTSAGWVSAHWLNTPQQYPAQHLARFSTYPFSTIANYCPVKHSTGFSTRPFSEIAHCRSVKRMAGFTLLELLVALVVFSILAAAAYSGLNAVLRTQEQLQEETQRLAEIQMAMYRLESDLSQASARPIRSDSGDYQAAMRSGESSDLSLEFTRSGWSNPLAQTRSNLQRVAYRLQNGQLYRRYWLVLDRGTAQQPRETLVLNHVKRFSLRYMDEQHRWLDSWPPLTERQKTAQAAASDASTITRPIAERFTRVPLAIELTLELEQWGTLQRIILSGGAG